MHIKKKNAFLIMSVNKKTLTNIGGTPVGGITAAG